MKKLVNCGNYMVNKKVSQLFFDIQHIKVINGMLRKTISYICKTMTNNFKFQKSNLHQNRQAHNSLNTEEYLMTTVLRDRKSVV